MIPRRAVLRAALMLPTSVLGGPGLVHAQAAPLVFLGDRALPPYEFLDGDTPRGANVDLAQAIGRVLGRPVEVRLMGWDEAQQRLLAGEGNALTMMGRSEQRERLFDFTQSTMPALFALFVRADQERAFVQGNRLGGVRIAIARGGLAAELLAASHPEAERMMSDDLPTAIDLLRHGMVDAVAGSAWSVRHLLVQRGITGITELPPFARMSGRIAVREGDAATLGDLDRALSVLKANGELDGILDRWSGTDAHLVPDWVVRTTLASGATAIAAVAALGWQALRLRARTARLSREIQERRRAEAALAASQERLALASATVGLGVWDVDPQARTGIVNREFRALYGLPPGDGPLPQEAWLACIHPDDRARLAVAAQAVHAGAGGSYHEEYRIVRPDTGEVRWIDARGSVVAARDGVPARLVGISQDVTERRREEERQMLLAREVDHRARNVLAVVQSVVRLSRNEDPKDFAAAVEGRVAALARAHSLLSRDRWTGADLAELMREEFAAYRDGEGVAIEGPALRLDASAVQPLSMVVHELATNAAKYGALSHPDGRVRIAWRLAAGQAGDERLLISWREGGGPPVEGEPQRRGFGSALVTATVRGQLAGSIVHHWRADGLSCDIDLPARTVLAGSDVVAADVPPEPAAPPAQALYGRRVLLVEDEPLVALALQEVLQDAGCTVRGPAGTLEEAGRLAADSSLDAAVMDVNLPGGPSLALGARLGERGVPVVYVTGLEELPAPAGPGAVVLRKPVRNAALLAALARAVAGAPVAS